MLVSLHSTAPRNPVAQVEADSYNKVSVYETQGERKSMIPLRRVKLSRGPGCLFLLDGFQILGKVLQPDVSKILVRLDLMKDGPPNGHFSRAVRLHNFIAGNGTAYARGGKSAPTVFCQQGKVGNFRFQGRSKRAIAFALRTMAGGAMRSK